MKLSNSILAALWIGLAGVAIPMTGTASDRNTTERHSASDASGADHFHKVSGGGHYSGKHGGHGHEEKGYKHGYGHGRGHGYGHGYRGHGHGHGGHGHGYHGYGRHHRPYYWHHRHGGYGYGHSGWYYPGYGHDSWDIILRYHFH